MEKAQILEQLGINEAKGREIANDYLACFDGDRVLRHPKPFFDVPLGRGDRRALVELFH